MEELTRTEMDLLKWWRDYLRTGKHVESINSSLVNYIMLEMLIERQKHLPEDIRPDRPTEDATFSIGSTSGTLSKWRKKWELTWDALKSILLE